MNILLVNSSEQGGAGRACLRLHQGLQQTEGVSSKMLLFKKGNPDIPECFEIYKNKKKELFKVLKHSAWNSRKFKTRNLPKGYENFAFPYSAHDIQNHPLFEWADIINLHWVTGLVDYPTFFKKIKKPIVWTIHDMFPFTGGHHFVKGFPMEAYQKHIEKNENVKINALKNTNLSVVSPSNWLMNQSKSSHVLGRFNHYNIPNGIDPEIYKSYTKEFARSVFGLPIDKKIVLFVAENALKKRKGFGLLHEAIMNLNVDNVSLAIVGSNSTGTEDLPNSYKLGKIHDERLMSIAYAAADLFVIPSIEENLPNTIMESITCGTPVVGFPIGGNSDMIVDYKNGLISKEVSAASLTEAIEISLNTEYDTGWIRQDAIKRFNNKKIALEHKKLFASLLSN